MLMTGVVASAVTSAVFLTVRPEQKPVDPFGVQIERAEAEMQSLAPSLKRLVVEELADGGGNSDAVIDVEYVTGMPEQAAQVPMVSVDDQKLTMGMATPWRLDVTSMRSRTSFRRILDIRRSSSVAHPGYIGVVELEMTKLTSTNSASGHLQFDPPNGFQVVSQAKYTELEGTKKYSQQVTPAALTTQSLAFHYDEWDPAQPPPEELPACVREQFHESIVQCTATEPRQSIGTQTATYFYSLRERKWSRQR